MEIKNMSYEQAAARLEEIVAALEKNEAPLDKALEMFEEGTALVSYCSKMLGDAKQKITELEKD